ncbi:hypothetical protein BBF96_09235 [Anoxybacter fermentans]|uniref:CzcB-like barrel-sandwich hybrid domain-containing protein n=1 Tax=Anoxybacter fermentans TaxID=1323375 RepID=A0A3S9SZ43_9FIRM|nr:HlyD family efflux transporter periplasmic adaptor subunit [Anoxybacter fermentans]AZR73554.1 hypothetical protein BBF96_09235 [Anoxybacter fermentans]
MTFIKNEPIIKARPAKRRKTNKIRNLKLLLFILIVLTLIVIIPYYLFVPKKEVFKLQEFEMARVGVCDFIITVPGQGTVVAGEETEIKVPIDGTVVKVNAQVGSLVKKGDVLIELDYEQLKEELTKAEFQYAKKIREKEQLMLEHERELKQLEQEIEDLTELYEKAKEQLPIWEKLFELGEISKAKLEEEREKLDNTYKSLIDTKDLKKFTIKQQQMAVEEINAAIEEQAQVVEELKKNLRFTRIRATIDGRLIDLSVKVGDRLNPGSIVARIINDKSFMVVGEVSLADINAVKVGQPVKIVVGGYVYTGQVTSIAPVARESVVEINVNFDQVPEDLRVQTSVSLEIQVGVLKNRLALPRGRYLSSGQERFVYRIEGDIAKKVPVNFGIVNGNYIEVKSGLEKGDLIIISSYDNFIHLDEIQVNLEGGLEK